jgi:hypothetical protein
MARSSKMSAQKRLRERQKAEKAEAKRELRRLAAQTERERGTPVAAREDLEGYGVVTPPDRDSGR